MSKWKAEDNGKILSRITEREFYAQHQFPSKNEGKSKTFFKKDWNEVATSLPALEEILNVCFKTKKNYGNSKAQQGTASKDGCKYMGKSKWKLTTENNKNDIYLKIQKYDNIW